MTAATDTSPRHANKAGVAFAYCVAVPRPKRPAPSSVAPGWPDVPCVDPAVEKIRLLALRLRDAVGTRSLRDVTAEVDLDHSVVSDMLAGRSWPDSRTIALLEVALNQALWPPHEGSS